MFAFQIAMQFTYDSYCHSPLWYWSCKGRQLCIALVHPNTKAYGLWIHPARPQLEGVERRADGSMFIKWAWWTNGWPCLVPNLASPISLVNTINLPSQSLRGYYNYMSVVDSKFLCYLLRICHSLLFPKREIIKVGTTGNWDSFYSSKYSFLL